MSTPDQNSSERLDHSFDVLIKELLASFPDADICERLAFNRLRHARARQHELADISPEIHPAASADPEIRRAYNAAERDFWRALKYLQRRLDHRARLAERKQNPTQAYAETLLKSDQESAPANAIAPENKPLAPTSPSAVGSGNTHKPHPQTGTPSLFSRITHMQPAAPLAVTHPVNGHANH